MFRYHKMRLLGMVAVLLLGITVAGAQEAMSTGAYKAPVRFAIKLPQYCWGQYFGRTEPQFQLPPKKSCGIRTNHFCPALIYLFQAQDESKHYKKKGLLRRAERGILYTKNGIADFPTCPLHTVVEKALIMVRAKMKRFQ